MTHKPKPKSFGWLFWLITAGIIALFVSLTFPRIVRSKMRPDQTLAISNLGQIYYALIGFNEEFGSFPSNETAAHVKEKHPSNIDLSGSSSNALFRQFFVAQHTDTERLFYAKISGTKKPDGDIRPSHLLEKGEVGFAYISGLSTKDDSTSPLLLTPLIPGTTRFDPKPFKGKAIVLRIDKSVQVYEIQKDGHIYDNGIDLLSPKHPVWQGKAPDIRYPDL